LRRRTARVAGGLLLFAVAIRLTVKDQVPILATLFYATPPCVLALGSLSWAALRGGRPALIGLAGALVGLGWQAGVSRFDRPQASGELRIVCWNAQNGSRGWDGLAAALKEDGPALVGLVEAQGAEKALPGRLPGYDWAWPGRGIAVGARGRILSSELRLLTSTSRAAVVRLELGGPMTVVMADFVSNPFRSRRSAFRALDVLVREVEPDLVMGDFNTTRDSDFFDGLRGPFRSAFEEAGRGWDLTWPRPLPLLSIDHVWCGPRIAPRAASHPDSPASDHLRVRVDAARIP
jgi:endonuclease/exonuclease/phosphatase family metal-dependent hydrolase